MLIIPAIDLFDGCVVRFVQGRLNKKVYSKDPLKTAKHWVRQGAEFMHVVDLDGAMSGTPKNLSIAKQIAKEAGVKTEFGGGIRKAALIDELLKSGVNRVVLGTKAIEDKAFLKNALKKYKDRVVVGLDAQEGKVMVKGWKSAHKNTDALKFAKELKTLGAKLVIYTDTLKDGTLTGPNIMMIKKLLKETGLEVIASGGISSLEDIYKLKKLEKDGLIGVIVGKALYEGRFTLKEALKLA